MYGKLNEKNMLKPETDKETGRNEKENSRKQKTFLIHLYFLQNTS